MKFEGVLEELQGFVDLAYINSMPCKIWEDFMCTWSSLVLSTSSSILSSGSRLIAAKAGCALVSTRRVGSHKFENPP